MNRLRLLWMSVVISTLFAFGFTSNSAPQPPRTEKREVKPETFPWEQAIKAFEASDKTNRPPKNAILFVGSSSIRMWKSVEQDFSEYKVINRGFGGSQISDSVRYAERIVLPYKPKAIIFYAGDNDLAAGKTPGQVFDDFKRFVYKVHWAQPKVKIYFVSVKPSPSRWKYQPQVVEVNRLIKEYCTHEKNLRYIDVYTAMIGADGKPRQELFAKDNLHMNEKGYALWTSLIKPNIEGL